MKHCFLLKIITLLTSLGSVLPASPAQSDQAFKTTNISLHGFCDVSANEFHQFWHPARGLGLSVTFPFYRGQFTVEINTLRFKARNPVITDFRAFYLNSGWGYELTILPRLKWLNGFALGNNFMVFDQGDASRGVKTESEFGYTLKSQVNYFISSNWSFTGAVQRQFIFTAKRIRLVFVSLALSYCFKTPRWLEEFLR